MGRSMFPAGFRLIGPPVVPEKLKLKLKLELNENKKPTNKTPLLNICNGKFDGTYGYCYTQIQQGILT